MSSIDLTEHAALLAEIEAFRAANEILRAEIEATRAEIEATRAARRAAEAFRRREVQAFVLENLYVPASGYAGDTSSIVALLARGFLDARGIHTKSRMLELALNEFIDQIEGMMADDPDLASDDVKQQLATAKNFMDNPPTYDYEIEE
jgi:hypothetical protein